MKIAMIGVRGIPSNSGGAEHVVEQLSVRLAKTHHVTVYCRKHYIENMPAQYKGVYLKYVSCINTKHLEAISHTFFCSLAVAFSNCDLVHYHSIGPSLMSWIPRLFGKKVISTCHGLDWKREKWGKMAKLFLKAGEWASAKFPHNTMVVSSTLLDYYKARYRKKVIYIPNGMVLPNVDSDESILTKFKLKKDGYILFLSRIVPEKRLDLLIDAFKKLETDLSLVVVGGGSHSDDYVDEMKKRAADNVIFTGPVYGMDKYHLFDSCLLYVLPSDIEGMPIALLEALSLSCVCITSDIPENVAVMEPSSDEKYGEIFRHGSVADLLLKMQLLIDNDSLRKKYKKSCADYIKKNYNWDDIVTKYESAMLKLIGKK